MLDLNIAEIFFEDGPIQYRYARKLSPDGTAWIRHGLFQAFHSNGTLASEGIYVDGLEDGLWRDFHENGQIAAEGIYLAGEELDGWRYWHSDGSESSD